MTQNNWDLELFEYIKVGEPEKKEKAKEKARRDAKAAKEREVRAAKQAERQAIEERKREKRKHVCEFVVHGWFPFLDQRSASAL